MILVTGGTGLVGSYILIELSKENSSIRAIYRNKAHIEKTKKIFEAHHLLSQFNEIEWVKADVIDYFQLKDAFQGIRKVYHAAAKVSFSTKDTDRMMNINIDGTTHIVNLCLEMRVEKLCYISSVSSLGSYQKGCTDEEALWQKTKKTTAYSISKYYAENEVWRASEEGLKVVILNPATILGYGNWNDSSLKIIKSVVNGLSFYSPGTNGFVGVKDVAIAKKLMESNIVNERFILVAENISFHKLFQIIAKAFDVPPPKYASKKWMAKILLYSDQLISKLTLKNPVLTKSTVKKAFHHQCYKADKIEQQLAYKFQDINEVMQDAALLYKKNFNL